MGAKKIQVGMGAEKDKETKRQGENGRGVSQN